MEVGSDNKVINTKLSSKSLSEVLGMAAMRYLRSNGVVGLEFTCKSMVFIKDLPSREMLVYKNPNPKSSGLFLYLS